MTKHNPPKAQPVPVPVPAPVTAKQALTRALELLEKDAGDKLVITKSRTSAKPDDKTDEAAARDAECWNVLRHLSTIL